MSENTTIPHKSFLLPSPYLLLKLFGIDKPAMLLYDLFKTCSNDSSFSMDMKTFKSTFNGKRKAQQKTIDKLINAIPKILNNDFLMNCLYHKEDMDTSIIGWENIINAYQPSIENDFPLFRRKLLEIIEVEKQIMLEAKTFTKVNELSTVLVNNKFIKQFLSQDEKQTLSSSSIKKEELELIMVRVVCKIILYCASYLDADYSYDFKDGTVNNKPIGKRSLFQSVFPIIEEDKYINPVGMLFRKWKINFGLKYYKEIEQFISVSGYSVTKEETQRTKLKQWRKCEKIAPNKEILNTVRGIAPEIKIDKTEEFRIILIYRLSVFNSKYFNHLVTIKNEAGNLFSTKNEIVTWMHENYSKFFDEAYSEVSKFYEGA